MEVVVKPYMDMVEMWKKVLNNSRITVGKEDLDKEPSKAFKKSILKSQHSPIRKLKFEVYIKDIEAHVTQQFSRHHVACETNPLYTFSEEIKPTDLEHFVTSSREDRTGIKRSERKQNDLINYNFEANAQGLIDASKKRLCLCADTGAVRAWHAVKKGVEQLEPILAQKMQPSCIHYGFCPEDPKLVKCNYSNSAHFNEQRRLFIGETI